MAGGVALGRLVAEGVIPLVPWERVEVRVAVQADRRITTETQRHRD